MSSCNFRLQVQDREPNIWVLEDDPASADLLEELLVGMGARPKVFHYPEDLLRELAVFTTAPDLFILDVMLPEISGIDVLRKIRQLKGFQFVPVVLLSALDELEFRCEAIDAGADDYINKPVSPLELRLRLRSLLRVKEFHENLEQVDNVLQTLVSIVEAKDIYTKGHSVRVAQLAGAIADRLSLGSTESQSLFRAGLLHDIGKIVIDSTILNKPGRLDATERADLNRHPDIGATILSPLEKAKDVVTIVNDHHERLDGSGYPKGKKAKEISFFTRVLSCCDIFDALTSDRPYRKALSISEAFTIIDAEVEKGWWDREACFLLKQVVTDGELAYR